MGIVIWIIPTYLIHWVFVKHLRTDLNALIKSLSIEAADRQEEGVHFKFYIFKFMTTALVV